MAKGVFQTRGTISTNADTTIAAAPGVGERIYVRWLTLTVDAAGTSSRLVVTDGVGGGVLARMATAVADAIMNINYIAARQTETGNALSLNTPLVVTTSGSGAATINYDISYEVR